MIAAILRVYFVLAVRSSSLQLVKFPLLTMPKLQKGETAAIWSCREDVVAIIVGQATMIRPLFTRRFWNKEPLSSYGYPSNKRSDGYESHELSNQSDQNMATRLGLRKVKDPYNVSVLHTKANESEEEIIPVKQDNAAVQRSTSDSSNRSNQKVVSGITVKREVDISTMPGKQ